MSRSVWRVCSRAACAVAMTISFLGCRAHPRLVIPPQVRSAELTLICEGPSYVLLGVGDHAQLIPALLARTRNGIFTCNAQALDAVAWSVDDPAIARVDKHGRVTALAPGHTIVRATADTLVGLREVHILPPVDHIAWSRPRVSLAVGDTTRLVAIAYDSSARVLERLPSLALSFDTDDGSVLIDWGAGPDLLVQGVHPGSLRLIAHVAQRADTAVVTVVSSDDH